MSDDINTDAIAIVARLRAADLFTLAERTAKRAELRLKDCIAFGEVTGGHLALWRALAKVVPVPRVASILGWQADTIARELRIPEARPTPVPVSEVRATAKPLKKTAPKSAAAKPVEKRARRKTENERRRVAPMLQAADVQAMIDLAVAPLRARIVELESIAERVPSHARSAPTKEAAARARLATYGTAGDVAIKVAKEQGVPLALLLSPRRTARIVKARTEVVRQLTGPGFGMSQPEIGMVLGLHASSVKKIQTKIGAKPVRSAVCRRLAA